jgi:uncharacterized protein (DUF302 family)
MRQLSNYYFHLLLTLSLFVFSLSLAAAQPIVVELEKTVVKVPLEDGVSLEDAIESMKLRANILNIKLVAELPLSKQIKAMGQESRFIGIYQFCEPLTAKIMVEYDMNFAAYLPCRISAVEDKNGKGWLIMMNMEMLLNDPKLNPKLKVEAETVWKNLKAIMNAGAAGEL